MNFEDLKREREEAISDVDLLYGYKFLARAEELIKRINREEPHKISKVMTGNGTFTIVSDTDEGERYYEAMESAQKFEMPDGDVRYSSDAMDELFELLSYRSECDFHWSDIEAKH